MIEPIYQYWYFHRPALARRLIALLLDGTGDPLALTGERRIGKTSFLLSDLTPEARTRGFLPVYVDIWQHRNDALEAVNYALQEAIDDLEVPATKAGKRMKTSVKKVGLAGASIDFGDEPTRRRPSSPYLLVDWLLKELVRTAGRPILLIFDEMQELARSKDGEAIISAIRSAITKSKGAVRVVFTGSSQDKLLELLHRSRAALYEGATTIAFPHLGEDFIEFLADRAKVRFRRQFAMTELSAVFERLHHQPRALIDLVFHFASSDASSISALLAERIATQLGDRVFDAQWQALKPLHRRICLRIARGEDVSSAEARQTYATDKGKNPVSPGTVTSALRTLQEAHIVTKIAGRRGGYQIDDPLFGEWIKREAGHLVGDAAAPRSGK